MCLSSLYYTNPRSSTRHYVTILAWRSNSSLIVFQVHFIFCLPPFQYFLYQLFTIYQMDSSSEEKAGDFGWEKQLANGASGDSTGGIGEVGIPPLVPHSDDSPLVILQQIDLHDRHHPMHWPVWKKWYIISVYCSLQILVAIGSTSYVSVESLIQEQFGGSTQVITLGQSLFVVGTAVGPAFLGPLS